MIARLALAAAVLMAPRLAAALDGDLLAMTPLSRIDRGLPWRATFFAASGPGVYAIAALDTGIEIADVTNPAAPLTAGALYLPSPAYDVAVAGNFAFVANGERGLAVIDISNPAVPVERRRVEFPGARAVALAGNFAYVAVAVPPPGSVFGLQAVDVTSPPAASAAGFLVLPNGALDVTVAGGIAYVGSGSEPGLPHGLHVVDVATTPATPALITTMATATSVNEIAIAGGTGYLATGFTAFGEFLEVDLAPSPPQIRAARSLADAGRGVAVAGSRAYVAAGRGSLVVFDISTPGDPRRSGALATGRESVGVAVQSGDLLLAERSSTGEAGLNSCDTSPNSLARLPYAEAMDAAAGSQRAYLLWRDRLGIYNTTFLAAPVLLGQFAPAAADFSALDVEFPVAVIAEGAMVRILDISDPANPIERGQATVSIGAAVRPVIEGQRLYVVNGRGVDAYDIPSPLGNPTWAGMFPTPGYASALAVAGTSGYLTAGDTFYALDLAPPAPTSTGSLQIAGEFLNGVDLDPVLRLAVATGLRNKLYLVNVAIGSPVGEGFEVGGPGYGVRFIGDHVAVARGEGGVEVFDVSNRLDPALDASQDTSGSVYALAADGPILLLAAGAAQQWLTRCETCPAGSCISNWPLVAVNSLGMTKLTAGGCRFAWSTLSGCCEFNLCSTSNKTGAGTTCSGPVTSPHDDPAGPPPLSVSFWSVCGRDSCDGKCRP